MALTTSLVGFWKCDEASSDLLDAHGANALTQTGSVGTAAGKVGTARSFPGGANYFSHAGNSDLQTGDIDYTVAYWAYFGNVTDYRLTAGKGAGGSYEWQTGYYAGTGRLFFEVMTPGGGTVGGAHANALGPPSANTWYHIVGWHDSLNNQVGITINGTLTTIVGTTGAPTAGSGAFVLGNRGSLDLPFTGLIDEFGFWKRVLTSGERAELYNGGAGLAYPFAAAFKAAWARGSNVLLMAGAA